MVAESCLLEGCAKIQQVVWGEWRGVLRQRVTTSFVAINNSVAYRNGVFRVARDSSEEVTSHQRRKNHPLYWKLVTGNWKLETIPLSVSAKILGITDTIFVCRSLFCVPMRVDSDKIYAWGKILLKPFITAPLREN